MGSISLAQIVLGVSCFIRWYANGTMQRLATVLGGIGGIIARGFTGLVLSHALWSGTSTFIL